jgi:hypothetical protein
LTAGRWASCLRPRVATREECLVSRENVRIEHSVCANPRTRLDWFICRVREPGAICAMAIEVDTKDCTAVTDGELDEMAELSGESRHPFSVGLLSKQTEEWVLLTTARENGRLKGYVFCTLERIGGTPSVLMALGAVVKNSKRTTVVRALMNEMYHRALMAFPDEDVLVGSRFDEPSGFELFSSLDDIVPRPGHRASGEERAWGRRLVKRFGIEAGCYDDRTFIVTGDGEGDPSVLFDFESAKLDKIDADVAAVFDDVHHDHGDHLIAFAWAMAENLEKLGS